MNKPNFIDLIKASLLIGVTGYGGPALVGMLKNKFVEEKKWINDSEFLEGLSLSQLLPGAISVTLIGYLGYKLRGLIGSIILPVFFLLPSVILIISLSWAYFNYSDLSFVQTGFIGLGALVVSLLINATLTLGRSIFGNFSIKNYKGYIISLIILAIGYFYKTNIVYLIIFSGMIGFFMYYFSSEIKEGVKYEAPHINLNLNHVHKNPAVYIILSLAIFIITLFLFFPLLWQLFYNFFKIGMFGFGGGYTVIPLIQKQVVETMGLVTFTEFRDGIAMGQITPGPVFITTTFIGFKVAGLSGAIISTIASYSPSLIAVVTLSNILLRIKHKKIVQVFIKGILSGFIGLLLMIVIQFGINSLINWQTYLIFGVTLTMLVFLKKDPFWALFATIILTAILL